MTDQEAGSNPFGHTCLIFSKLNKYGEKIQVENCFGYYAAAEWQGYKKDPDYFGKAITGSTLSLFAKLKRALGLDLDFIGSHGTLKQEEMRYIDRGVGLNGRTFELTQPEYEKLYRECESRIDKQTEAITDMAKFLNTIGEKTSARNIYIAECMHAEREGRRSRLEPFELRFKPAKKIITMIGSTTCKSMALKILNTSEVEKDSLFEFSKRTFPLDGVKKSKVHLHSSGPLSSHYSRRTKQNYFFRKWSGETNIHWSLPPKENMVYQSFSYHTHQHVLGDLYDQAEKLVVKIQKIEWELIAINTKSSEEENKAALLYKLRRAYQPLAIMHEGNQDLKFKSSIKQCKLILSELYQAILENDPSVTFLDKKSIEKICKILNKPAPGTCKSIRAVAL